MKCEAKEEKKEFAFPNFSKQNLGGFNITEILVTTAIISILIGIVIVVSVPVRKTIKDARIKSDLLQILNRAERVYLEQKSYIKVCLAEGCDAEILALGYDIDSQGGSANIKRAARNLLSCSSVHPVFTFRSTVLSMNLASRSGILGFDSALSAFRF